MTRTLVPGRVQEHGNAFLARLGALTQVVFAALLSIVASFGNEPGFLPRGVVLLLVFSMPGLVGWMGAQRRRPALLVAAGLTSFLGAFVAFSGVTLIFLVPALLLFTGAVQVHMTDLPKRRDAVAQALAQAVVGVAITALLAGAGVSALLITDDACWAEYPVGTGPRIQLLPYATGEMTAPTEATSMSCSTGLISARGVALASLLWGCALVLAQRSSRRRKAAVIA